MTRFSGAVRAATIGTMLLIRLIQPKLELEGNIEFKGDLIPGISIATKAVSRSENPETVGKKEARDGEERTTMLYKVQQTRECETDTRKQDRATNSATNLRSTEMERAGGEGRLTRFSGVVRVATHWDNAPH